MCSEILENASFDINHLRGAAKKILIDHPHLPADAPLIFISPSTRSIAMVFDRSATVRAAILDANSSGLRQTMDEQRAY
jgi:hypothetical protein